MEARARRVVRVDDTKASSGSTSNCACGPTVEDGVRKFKWGLGSTNKTSCNSYLGLELVELCYFSERIFFIYNSHVVRRVRRTVQVQISNSEILSTKFARFANSLASSDTRSNLAQCQSSSQFVTLQLLLMLYSCETQYERVSPCSELEFRDSEHGIRVASNRTYKKLKLYN